MEGLLLSVSRPFIPASIPVGLQPPQVGLTLVRHVAEYLSRRLVDRKARQTPAPFDARPHIRDRLVIHGEGNCWRSVPFLSFRVQNIGA